MAIAKCVFCGKEREDYKGMYFMKNDGSSNYYCSSKCKKGHISLRRDKRKIRWTESFHEQRKKREARAKEKELKEKEKSEKENKKK